MEREKQESPEQAVETEEVQDDEESGANLPITEMARRAPTAEKERLIDEMIEQRRKTMKKSAAIEDYDEEHEIIGNYEYLDHTADIQLHGWGDTLEQALEQVTVAMFGYMTSIRRIKVNEEQSEEFGKNIVVTGHDLSSLVFAFLQEWLYIFHDSGFVARELSIQPIDREQFGTCTSSGKGEVVDWARHTQGTEIKAVTYSNLQVKESEDRWDIFVIVDI